MIDDQKHKKIFTKKMSIENKEKEKQLNESLNRIMWSILKNKQNNEETNST